MLGKYNFTKDQYLKFSIFFDEILVSLDTLINIIDKDLKISTVYRKSFNDVYESIKNLTFIDDFIELKDKFMFFYQDINNVLIVENKNRVVDRHLVLKFVEQAAELIRVCDLIAKLSYNNTLNNNDVLDIEECIVTIWNEIHKHLFQVIQYGQNYNKVFTDKSFENIKSLKSTKNLYDWENKIEFVLDELEEYAIIDKDLHDIFIEGTSDYWYLVAELNKILILILLVLTLLKKRKVLRNKKT
ncbi:hypothetical protein [Spiroplasma turonicum]|uniref:Uncharacterized protein n=1 Tax=Spiroplasma turonicum TaxID=216946 RepID=A0A0K1P5L9_9MOLU|nr:hypothetical protein [Spiroplasma turonicum]AKU79621.1 hypothetical protein STURON_00375 [Spiroplasma turonicum]ALX70643.1 hypothetical protein STURO_v1c03750 [Spiroplasma turonicum]